MINQFRYSKAIKVKPWYVQCITYNHENYDGIPVYMVRCNNEHHDGIPGPWYDITMKTMMVYRAHGKI